MALFSFFPFLAETINITLIYLSVLFIVQILKKILPGDPESRGRVIFESKIVVLLQTIFFLKKL